jgi:hypothetical protein
MVTCQEEMYEQDNNTQLYGHGGSAACGKTTTTTTTRSEEEMPIDTDAANQSVYNQSDGNGEEEEEDGEEEKEASQENKLPNPSFVVYAKQSFDSAEEHFRRAISDNDQVMLEYALTYMADGFGAMMVLTDDDIIYSNPLTRKTLKNTQDSSIEEEYVFPTAFDVYESFENAASAIDQSHDGMRFDTTYAISRAFDDASRMFRTSNHRMFQKCADICAVVAAMFTDVAFNLQDDTMPPHINAHSVIFQYVLNACMVITNTLNACSTITPK